MPYFDIPVNLVHAATIAKRLCSRIAQSVPPTYDSEALEQANLILSELFPYHIELSEPNPAEQMIVSSHVLDLVRHLVVLLNAEQISNDRIGQSVRNLFECLGRGEEGAKMGLRAGENPNSLQRPL